MIEVDQIDDKPYPLVPRKYSGCYNKWSTIPSPVPSVKVCQKCDSDAQMQLSDWSTGLVDS